MSNASDFIIENGVLTKYVGPGGDVVIPEGITSIGNYAFYMCSSLRTVHISEGVTSVGDYAFSSCASLYMVSFPEKITTVGNDAFSWCSSLQTVCLPDTVTSIGNSAFYMCSSLQKVNIHADILSIGKNAFRNCKQLADEDGFVIVAGVLYDYCGEATSVTIPNGVTSIEGYALGGVDGLREVNIPESVTSIDNRAFGWSRNLTKLTVPVHLGSCVSKMLDYSDSLRINIPELSALPAKFRLCAALCFAEDSGLREDLRFESHSKYLKSNSGKMAKIAADNPALLYLLCREKWIKAKDAEAFLTTVQQTNNAECVALLLDYQKNMLSEKEKTQTKKKKEEQENVVLEQTVARVNKNGIDGLSFMITGNVATFKNRSEFKAYIESKGAKLQSSMTVKTDYLIMNDTNSDTEKKHKAEELGIEIISELQFNEMAGRQFLMDDKGTLIKYRGNGGNVVIPDGTISIGNSAFSGCNSLHTVHIPEGITAIGEYAFSWCGNLQDVHIPKSVTTIGDRAFLDCSKLQTVYVSAGVLAIGEYAFALCSSLQTVHIPESVTAIGDNVFPTSGTSTIYGKTGSYAETYAKENNIPFVAE